MTDLTTRAAALLEICMSVQTRWDDGITEIGTLAWTAPVLIRELLAENERWRNENNRLRLVVTENLQTIMANELLRAEGTESPTPIDEAKDAGPSPFQGRTTRRDEDDDKEYNFMMSHYEGRN